MKIITSYKLFTAAIILILNIQEDVVRSEQHRFRFIRLVKNFLKVSI